MHMVNSECTCIYGVNSQSLMSAPHSQCGCYASQQPISSDASWYCVYIKASNCSVTVWGHQPHSDERHAMQHSQTSFKLLTD